MKRKLLTFGAISLGVALISRKRPDASPVARDDTEPPTTDYLAPLADMKVTKAQTEPPRTKPYGVYGYVRRTFSSFMEDECMTYGASVGYYGVFSLAPLLLFVIAVAGIVLGRETVQARLQEQIAGVLGPDAASQIGTMMQRAAENPSKNVVGAIIGFVVLLFGATGAFVALQDALNKVWHVRPDPDAGVKAFLGKRLLSFGLILVVGFLLLISLVISAALAAVGKWLSQAAPSTISEGVMQGLGMLASWFVIAILFAAILRVLPDARIEWRNVALGAAMTSALFTIGRPG